MCNISRDMIRFFSAVASVDHVVSMVYTKTLITQYKYKYHLSVLPFSNICLLHIKSSIKNLALSSKMDLSDLGNCLYMLFNSRT